MSFSSKQFKHTLTDGKKVPSELAEGVSTRRAKGLAFRRAKSLCEVFSVEEIIKTFAFPVCAPEAELKSSKF